MTNSPPARLTIRAQATLDSASFIGSARQKRRMPLRASTSNASAMNSGLAVSRSEEHTSELQSPCNLVCRLLLEKKKKHKYVTMDHPDAAAYNSEARYPTSLWFLMLSICIQPGCDSTLRHYLHPTN